MNKITETILLRIGKPLDLTENLHKNDVSKHFKFYSGEFLAFLVCICEINISSNLFIIN